MKIPAPRKLKASHHPVQSASSSKTQMTLDRVLSRHGLASRTVAAEWIHTGRVRVNSTIERNEGRWIDLKRDRIKVDDRAVSTAKKVYVILNKPANVVTSHGDPQGRKTVYDYLLGLTAWVSPVGRLDKDTSGLLLLTNDTDFGNRLTDPQSKIPKKYWAKVNAVLEEEELVRLRKGIEIEAGLMTRPCIVTWLRKSEKYSWLEITITEGKNRQIRRMIEALGRKVIKLVRLQIGGLRLGELAVGKWRELTSAEVRMLKNK